jgi:hypothetical protein
MTLLMLNIVTCGKYHMAFVLTLVRITCLVTCLYVMWTNLHEQKSKIV